MEGILEGFFDGLGPMLEDLLNKILGKLDFVHPRWLRIILKILATILFGVCFLGIVTCAALLVKAIIQLI